MNFIRFVPIPFLLLPLGCGQSGTVVIPPSGQRAQPPAIEINGTQVSKPTDTEIVLTRSFNAPREAVFAALTQPEHVLAWMKPTHMTLASCEIDLRAGGKLRYVFERPNGQKIEVLGVLNKVESPHCLDYEETYDFSTLKVHVTTELKDVGNKTNFKQTLRYATQQERDEDFPGVTSSSREVYPKLEAYLIKAGK